MSTWTAVYRDGNGATQMTEVEAETRPEVYESLARKGIHPLNVVEGSLRPGADKGRKRKRKPAEGSAGNRTRLLLLLLLLLVAGAYAWYRWGNVRCPWLDEVGYKLGVKPIPTEVEDRLRPPGKISVRIADP